MNPLTSHPNASAAGGAGGVGVFVVWLLGSVFHVSLSAEEGAVIAGGASTVIVFIGRDGIAGAWDRLIHGKKK